MKNTRDLYQLWLDRLPAQDPLRAELLAVGDDEKEISDRFYQEIEFGTAGLRGICGAGTNRMNRLTVGRATKAIADYILASGEDPARGVAIAYDCRYFSKEFSELAASILMGQGIRAYLFPSMRPTPELSFAIRKYGAVSGINMTASHNPREYNGYKVYWQDGAQISGAVSDGILAGIRKLDLFGLVSGLLNFTVLLLNHSLGCLLAVVGAVVFLLILTIAADRPAAQRLGLLLGCFAGFLLLGLLILAPLRSEFAGLPQDLHQILSGEDASSAGHNRWLLWSQTIDLISQRPLFGYGCEGIADILKDAVDRANPHNELLTYAAFYGIPAALFYVLGLVAIFVCWIRRKIWTDPVSIAAALAAFGYFLSSLFGVPMFYTAPFFFVFLGLSLTPAKDLSILT